MSKKIQEKPSRADRYIRTAYGAQRKGSFSLRLPTGKLIMFKDAAHRAAAVGGATQRRFKNMLELVEYYSRCPNGYSAFIDPELTSPLRF